MKRRLELLTIVEVPDDYIRCTVCGKLSDIIEVNVNDIYEHILEFLTLNNIEDVELVGNDIIIWAKFDQN